MKPSSSQLYLVKEQETMGTNWNKTFHLKVRVQTNAAKIEQVVLRACVVSSLEIFKTGMDDVLSDLLQLE